MNETVRNQAWIGDAVLSLYVREWLSPRIDRTVPDRNALHELFTSNQFLSGFGEPTAVEMAPRDTLSADDLAVEWRGGAP